MEDTEPRRRKIKKGGRREEGKKIKKGRRKERWSSQERASGEVPFSNGIKTEKMEFVQYTVANVFSTTSGYQCFLGFLCQGLREHFQPWFWKWLGCGFPTRSMGMAAIALGTRSWGVGPPRGNRTPVKEWDSRQSLDTGTHRITGNWLHREPNWSKENEEPRLRSALGSLRYCIFWVIGCSILTWR